MKTILIFIAFFGLSITAYAASDCLVGTECAGTTTPDSEPIPDQASIGSGNPIHDTGQLSTNCMPPEFLDPSSRTADAKSIGIVNGVTPTGGGTGDN